MEEIWKNIPGYEGYYQVSNYGEIKSLDRKVLNNVFKEGFQSIKGKNIKFRIDSYGYYEVGLSKNGSKQIFRVNRIVWFTFMGGDLHYYNPLERTVVCHKNNEKKDNYLENLYLGTQKENIQQARKEGRLYTQKKGSI